MLETGATSLESMVLEFGSMTLGAKLSRAQFTELLDKYPEITMERGKNGKVTLMSPVKRSSGQKEAKIIFLLSQWCFLTGFGEVYSSSTIFDLPDGSNKSPDCAWLSDSQLGQLPEDEDEGDSVDVCPEFVIEVRSSSDRLKPLQKKMTESWMKNGTRLAWLIDPHQERAYIYRLAKAEPEVVIGFDDNFLLGEDVLPGFKMPLDVLKKRKKLA